MDIVEISMTYDLEEFLRGSDAAMKFITYYTPMLDRDRREIDHNFALLSTDPKAVESAPATRYDSTMDGLELTMWMMDDFEHILRSGDIIDRDLQRFNEERRRRIVLPPGWGDIS